MIKVKNGKVISEIARITYRGNRNRNLLTILAICLTTFLITVIITLGFSYWNTISTRMIRMNGMDYDIELSEPDDSQVETIRAMDSVKMAGLDVKCGIMDSFAGVNLEKIRMYWLDETCWEKQSIPALESYEGIYPKVKNEIMISSSALKAMGIENPTIGMKLKLNYFLLVEGGQENIETNEFTLSGYYKDYSGKDRIYVSEDFFKGTGVKQTDFTQGRLKISLKNSLYSEADILSIQNQLNMHDNQFIGADYDTISDFCNTIVGLIGILIMIFASGYLFIYNTLYISIAKDIRYYGQLKTIGMTSKQLKSMIYKQTIWNSVFGIPFGLIFGILVANVAVPRMIHLTNPSLSIDEIAMVQPWVYLIAIVFAFVTNMISSKKPAKIAADSSPIEALRYLPSKKSKKERKSEGRGLGSMALQNIFRDKKQAFVILLSFVIAVSIFLIVNVVIKGREAKSILDATYSYDVQFINQSILDNRKQQLTDEKIAQIEAVDGVERVSKVTSTKVVIPYQEDVFSEYFKNVYASRYSPGNLEDDMKTYKDNPESNFFAPRCIGIDEYEFDKLNETLGGVVDKEAFENGEIAVVSNFITDGADEGMSGKVIDFYFPEDGNQYTIKIAKVIARDPAYFAGGYLPNLIISEKYAEKILGNTVTELINVTYDKSYSKSTEDAVLAVLDDNKKVSHNSKLDRYQEMITSEMQVKILGNCIGLIMALLALLNYVNMMTASVQNRAKEFATLESIGMTSGQRKRVLAYEGIGYALISIFLSLLGGIPISILVFNSMNLYGIDYVFPWLSNLILAVVALILCMVVPVMIYQKTQKESIIDRLRKAEDI